MTLLQRRRSSGACLSSAGLLALLMGTTAAQAAIVEFSGTFAVTQTITVLNANPYIVGETNGNAVYEPELGETRPFFDEYYRVLTDEATVLGPTPDRDALLANPINPYDSDLLIQGTWRFDSSVLRNLDGYSDPNGVLLSEENLTGTFVIGDFGIERFGISRVFVGNNFVDATIFDDTVSRDVIAIQSAFVDPEDGGIDGPLLIFAKDDNWFEDTPENEIPDFDGALTGFFFEQQTNIEGTDQGLFDEVIRGLLISDTGGFTVLSDNSGSDELNPILTPDVTPNTDPDSGLGDTFSFDLSAAQLEEAQTIWLDPDVATGYIYTVTGAEFGTITLPGVSVPDPDGYEIWINGVKVADVVGEQVFDFVAAGYKNLTSFEIRGINPDLLIDPTDTAAFNLGVSFLNFSQEPLSVSQTAIIEFYDPTTPIPLPAGGVLLLSGLGALAALRRKRRA